MVAMGGWPGDSSTKTLVLGSPEYDQKWGSEHRFAVHPGTTATASVTWSSALRKAVCTVCGTSDHRPPAPPKSPCYCDSAYHPNGH